MCDHAAPSARYTLGQHTRAHAQLPLRLTGTAMTARLLHAAAARRPAVATASNCPLLLLLLLARLCCRLQQRLPHRPAEPTGRRPAHRKRIHVQARRLSVHSCMRVCMRASCRRLPRSSLTPSHTTRCCCVPPDAAASLPAAPDAADCFALRQQQGRAGVGRRGSCCMLCSAAAASQRTRQTAAASAAA